MTRAADFLALAERESSRYGDDPWVFVRELLQNARDAGARNVRVRVWSEAGREFFILEDDGRGMTWAQARAFLLTLHASSKINVGGTAGKFGVGFWSVLRFLPDEIVLRSSPSGKTRAWEATFSADLEDFRVVERQMEAGTGVMLSRSARGVDLENLVWEAVRRYARHLRVRGAGRAILRVMVNGRVATERMCPGVPGLSFSCRGVFGIVTLAEEAGIEVLAHGLQVRTAATVDDLLLEPGRKKRKRISEVRRGFAPQVVVDSDRLAVLAARGDLAQDRELLRMARRVRDEVHRLMIRELDRVAPRSQLGRVMDWISGRWKGLTRWVIGILGILAVAFGLARSFSQFDPGVGTDSAVEEQSATQVIEPYFDRSESYGGPIVDPIRGGEIAPDILFSPSGRSPWLAVFRIIGLTEGG
ncbi:MAG: ATP-binding protein, partial [Thermoanaerobaculales bacterium]|nr:ATP-binding protein [Thermoanaerobaculales bacterium]